MRARRYNYRKNATVPTSTRTQSIYRFEIRVLSTLCLIFLAAIININVNRFKVSQSNDWKTPSQQRQRKKLTYNEPIYYNVEENRRLSNFPADYPTDGPVVAILVASRQKDVDEVCTALKSLVFLGGDSEEHPAPVLIFNEGDLTVNQTEFIIDCTERPIAFPLVDFTEFPEGFDHHVESKMFRVGGRKEWGYYQMIRFWISGIWDHPALEPYETIMRIDTDSCLREVVDYLPNFQYPKVVYHSEYVGVEDGKNYTTGLLDFATDWLEENGRVVGDPMMWDFIQSTWKKHRSLPVFRTNFELSSKKFMQQKFVRMWHEAMTELEPYGLFRYRWGDAVERFMTMAMFTTNAEIMTKQINGYNHKNNCGKEEVEKAVDEYLRSKSKGESDVTEYIEIPDTETAEAENVDAVEVENVAAVQE